MLVCDSIITEAQTNKKTLVGVFDTWHVPQTPFTIGPFWVYIKMTDATGKYIFRLKLVVLDNEKVVAEAVTREVEIKDRLSAFEIPLPMPPIPIPEFGGYELQIYANDVYVGRSVVNVQRIVGG